MRCLLVITLFMAIITQNAMGLYLAYPYDFSLASGETEKYRLSATSCVLQTVVRISALVFLLTVFNYNKVWSLEKITFLVWMGFAG